MLITLRIQDNLVQDARFKCMGCAVAIACSSMATEMILGKPVEETYGITDGRCRGPGRHSRVQMRRSNLAPAAIRNADDWRSRHAG